MAQVESLAYQHPHPHAGTQHCCARCHTGPLSMLQTPAATAVSPDLTVAWIAGCFDSEVPRDILLSDGSSRAPPDPGSFLPL